MPYIPSGGEVLDPPAILTTFGIAEGMVVSDLGCGTSGHFVFPAARMVGPNGKVYAVDILKSALAGIESRRKLEGATNVEEVWADIEVYGGTKIPEGSADRAILVNVRAKPGMMKEAWRELKSGGELLVVEWKPTAAPFGPPTKDRRAADAVKADAAQLGFVLKKEFDAGQYHYGLIFRKP